MTSVFPDCQRALGIPARVIGGDDKSRGYGMPSREEMQDVTFTIDCIIKEMGTIKKELNIAEKDCAAPEIKKKRAAKK